MAVNLPLRRVPGSRLWVYQDALGNSIAPSAQEITVLLELYKDNAAQGRHHETQRSTITTVCFAFAGAYLGLIAKDGTIKYENRWLTLALIVVSLVGLVLSHKQYERFRLHNDRARNCRRAMNSATLRVDELKWQADDEHDGVYKFFHRVHLNTVWTVLFLVLAGLGASLAWLAWHAPRPAP